MPELLDLPPEIMLAIIKFVGFPGMFDLRQVCRNFRNLIDDRKPNPRLKDLSIRLLRGNIRMLCLHNSKPYLIEYPKSNQEQFFNDLETILISQKATVIKSFYTPNAFRRIPKFYNKFKKFLESRPFLLKIEKLVMDAKNQNQLYSILSKLDPKALKKILIHCPRGGIPNFGRIVELEQWKNAKELYIFDSVMDMPFSSFAHFSDIHVHLKTINFEELEEFRKALLTSQDPDLYCFVQYNEMIGEEQWRQSLGPNYGEKGNKWFFQFEKSTKGLHIYWGRNFISISIIDVNSLQSE